MLREGEWVRGGQSSDRSAARGNKVRERIRTQNECEHPVERARSRSCNKQIQHRSASFPFAFTVAPGLRPASVSESLAIDGTYSVLLPPP